MNDNYIIKEGKRLRCGYTTGSCAAAAAKGAAMMLLGGEKLEYVKIDTPAGIELTLKLENIEVTSDYAVCSVTKDAGDDPDATDKMDIFAKVKRSGNSEISIDGGEGIGRITRSGFWGEKGEAAINPVPRKMIKNELLKLGEIGFEVIIYAPQGREIAKKTFNSNIGIVDGISIIGTKGIVEPMSEEALKKSIYMEIDEIFERGVRKLVLFPGNYGEGVVKNLKLEGVGVKISNFIGDILLYCKYKGFEDITLVGHLGKLCKLAIGVFNTHSRTCDGRMEAFVYYLALAGAPIEILHEINECKTSEEALNIVRAKKYDTVIDNMIAGCEARIRRYLKDETFKIKVIMYSMDHGILGGSND